TKTREHFLHLRHEGRRSAEVDISLPWQADLVEDRARQMTGGVEILALLIVRAWPAVADIAAAAGTREHEMPHFSGDRILLRVGGAVQPQHQSCRTGCR